MSRELSRETQTLEAEADQSMPLGHEVSPQYYSFTRVTGGETSCLFIRHTQYM